MSIFSKEQQATILPVGTWTVDPAHSAVEFQAKHLMIATVKGRFTAFEGTLEAGEDGVLRAYGTVQTASIDTHEPQRDEHLRSPDFFDAAAYPQITFRSLTIWPLGGPTFRIVGELTIKGITKTVELEATVQGAGRDPWGNERVALEARGEIDRKDFGLTWNQVLETGGVLVGDKVKILVDVSAVQAAEAQAA